MTIRGKRNQQRMKKLTGAILLVGGPANSADLRYATGYATVDPAVYAQHGARKWLLVPLLEKGRAQKEALQGVKVLTPFDLKLSRARRRRLAEWILALAKAEKIKRFTVGAWCPAALVDCLREAGLRVRVSSLPMFPGRAVKTAREVALITEAQEAAVFALSCATAFLRRTRISRDGWLLMRGKKVTSEDVRRLIDHALLDRGCLGTGTIAACGAQGADPHERGSGPLRAGQPIVLDIFPQNLASGYWGDLSRTVVRGKANRRVRAIHRAVRTAQRLALRKIRAGVSAERVHHVASSALERAGFVTRIKGERPEGFIHSLGHGVGLEIHEAPGVGPAKERLRAGNVITVEPGLYYGGLGGMRIEDTVLVTRTGYRLLARAPEQLEL